MPATLEVRDITLKFGGLVALSGVKFDVNARETVGLIGPNGAGKTSLFNVITGLYRPSEGAVVFNGKDITRVQQHQIARAGVGRTFQHVMIFPALTCFENVMSGFHCRTKTGLVSAILRDGLYRREEEQCGKRTEELLELVGLKDVAGVVASSLSYGDRRRLDIARALATEPELLLLDEPAAGLNQTERQQLKGLILTMKDLGKAIVLIEHDMRFVMNLVDKVVVLDHGVQIACGSPAEVRQDPQVIEAYLGKGA